jgi:biotin transporter BioY
LGFLPAAFVSGLAWRSTSKYKLALNIVLGILGAAIIEFSGMVGLGLGVMQGNWLRAFSAGVVPFIFVDSGKAILAATLVNLGHQSWLRWIMPRVAPDVDKQ